MYCEAASLFKMGSNITLHVCTVGKPPCPGADSSIKTAWAMEGYAERMMKLLAAWLEVFLCEMIYVLTQSSKTTESEVAKKIPAICFFTLA